MATGLLIFPCNDLAIEALDCLPGSGYELIGFVDDAEALEGSMRYGHLVHPRAAFERWPEAQVLAVPGRSGAAGSRRAAIQGLALAASRFARLVHPQARVSPLAALGRNVLILAGVVVTGAAWIGDHVCLLPNAVLHHDVRIGAWTLVGSNATLAGQARIGDSCEVGNGSCVSRGVVVGDEALVGIGSNVIRHVEAGTRVAGNPARRIAARAGVAPQQV